MDYMRLRELGFAIIPVIIKTKKPALSGWPKYYKEIPVTDAMLADWFRRPCNVAALLGKPSGCVVIDIDDPVLAKEVLANNSMDTPVATSGRGIHIYYRYEERLEKLSHCTFLPKIEFRTNGDLIMLPPSIHPSGRQYTWLRDPWSTPFAPLPEKIFEAIVSFLQKESAPAPVVHIHVPSYPSTSKGCDRRNIPFAEMGIDWLEFYRRRLQGVRGGREWIAARCPFHQDEKASFSFSVVHGGWRCHAGCGHGNPITFLQRYYQCSLDHAKNLLQQEWNERGKL